jgi:hypothetical protein
VEGTAVLINGPPTDYAFLMPHANNGVTNGGVGACFDRFANGTVLFEVADALCKPRHRTAAVRLLEPLASDPKVLIVPTGGILYNARWICFDGAATRNGV